MSLDRSLKTSGGLSRHRNVLSRAERIDKLAKKSQFNKAEGDPLGLPKVGNRKVATGGKKKDPSAVDAVAAAPAADAKGKK